MSYGEPNAAPDLSWGAYTHTGMVRAANEDSHVAEAMVQAVADGMGGHAAGEVASAIAAATLRDRLAKGVQSVDLMVAAVVEANAAIFQAAHSSSDQRGMGTTVVALAALLSDSGPTRLVLANVGDSRAYVQRNGSLIRLSVDHSYVQELVNTGHISELEARTHPRRNIVTRALGIEPTVKVDTWVLPLVQGDRYVLCSDGLVDEVDDDQISRILGLARHPQAAAESLVQAANANGGHDNTTVVVIDVLDGEPAPADGEELATQWSDEPPRHLVDADADMAPHPPITVAPAPDEQRGFIAGLRGRPGVGVFLFLFSLGVIAMLTVVLLLVAGSNDSPAPTTSTTVESSTTTTTLPSTTTTGG